MVYILRYMFGGTLVYQNDHRVPQIAGKLSKNVYGKHHPFEVANCPFPPGISIVLRTFNERYTKMAHYL